MTERDKGRDKRLRRKYGISLKEYNLMLKRQGGGCAICGSTKKKQSLHVDHDHTYKYLKVKTLVKLTKKSKVWFARIDELEILVRAPEKNTAIQAAREIAKRKANRGIICFPCNGGLRKFKNNWKIAMNAGKYLKRFQRQDIFKGDTICK